MRAGPLGAMPNKEGRELWGSQCEASGQMVPPHPKCPNCLGNLMGEHTVVLRSTAQLERANRSPVWGTLR